MNKGLYDVYYHSQTCNWSEKMSLSEVKEFVDSIGYGTKCSIKVLNYKSDLVYNKDMWDNKPDINLLQNIDSDLRTKDLKRKNIKYL